MIKPGMIKPPSQADRYRMLCEYFPGLARQVAATAGLSMVEARKALHLRTHRLGHDDACCEILIRKPLISEMAFIASAI